MIEPSANALTITYAIQTFDETGSMRAPYLLLKGFVSAGWQTEIVTTEQGSNRHLDQIWESVPILKIAGSSKVSKLLRLAWHFVSRRKHNLVISWIWDWHCYGLLLSHLLFGSNYAIVLDTYSHRAFGSKSEKRFQALRYGPILRHASLILAEAPACRDAILKRMPKANVKLIPSCLWRGELAAIETAWENEGWQPVRKPVILYAGRLVERKNVHLLIDAFATLAADFPEWSLEIIGPETSPEYGQRLQTQVADAGLQERVTFQPGLAGEALYRKYRTCAIYVLPSEGEGFPTSILEAMYFGGAIVASGSGYVAYQLEGGCGLIHKPGDLQQLKADLQTLMSAPQQRCQLMERARQRMIDTFTWENYFPKLEAECRQRIT